MAHAAPRIRMSAGGMVADLLYPRGFVCCACDREALVGEDLLCDDCREALEYAPQTLFCPPELNGLTAGLVYNEAIEPAMHRFKYQRGVWLAPFFASHIILSETWAVDCLVPVPLHPLREWERSYNQSELLCRSLMNRYTLPIRNDLIRRTRYTKQQAKLSAEERARNLKGAFMANTNAEGLSIILVDDVTTTHNTLIQCAIALKHAGAKRVYGVCACVAGMGK